MDNRLINIKKAAEQTRLSVHEKDVMRARIYERIDASYRAQAAIRRRQRSGWVFFSMRSVSVAALVFAVFVGSTTTYAAQWSLPGGLLYPVKIYVNESVQGALALSEESRVSFHTEVAQERLREAEALASEDRLDERTAAVIEENFNTHVAKAETAVASLEENDPASGVEVRAELDSSLLAHSSILARIGEGSDNEQTKNNSRSMSERVRSRNMGGVVAVAMQADAAPAAEVSTMSLSAVAPETPTPDPEASVSSKSSGETARTKNAVSERAAPVVSVPSTAAQKKIALQLQKKATTQLERVGQSFKESSNFLDASTTLKVEERLKVLEAQLDTGNTQTADTLYEAARATFTEVIKGSVGLKTLIEASKKYKRDLVRSKQESDDDSRGGGRVAGAETEKDKKQKDED